MIKQTLIAFGVFFSVFLSAQDKVSELHYKLVAVKDNKKSESVDVVYFKNYVSIQTKPAHSRNPLRYIDKKNNVLVMTFNSRSHGYIIESLDSVYFTDTRLEATGEKQVINGYNCEKYISTQLARTRKCPSTYTMGYSYELWLTTDLDVDPDYNLYISHAFFPMVSTFPFKGVIVKARFAQSLGKKDTYFILDSVSKKPALEDNIEWPWVKYPDAVCVLPDADDLQGYAKAMRYTCEDLITYRTRMKKIAQKVTGIETPKYDYGYEMIVF